MILGWRLNSCVLLLTINPCLVLPWAPLEQAGGRTGQCVHGSFPRPQESDERLMLAAVYTKAWANVPG